MRCVNDASIGDMPPSTCLSDAFSARTASDASFTMSAYADQSGSSSRSQCDLLLGSFQNLTASIMFACSWLWLVIASVPRTALRRDVSDVAPAPPLPVRRG